MTKHESLGRIFGDLEPDAEGNFILELGVTLPDILPNLEGNPDYTVEVALSNGDLRLLSISNRMILLHYERDGKQLHAIFPNEKLDAVKQSETFKIPPAASPQHLRTTVTSRFKISGTDAEDALERNIEISIFNFMESLNKLRSSIQTLPSQDLSILSTRYESQSFPYFYMIVQGDPPTNLQHGKISTHIGRVALMANPIPADESDLLLSYLNGTRTIDPVMETMGAAKSSLDSGLLNHALLMMVIAAEMATSRYVKQKLLERGVSKSKWDESKTDVTYSQMLNLHLFALAPASLKPHRSLVGEMNKARTLRNKLMHEGEFASSKEDVQLLFSQTTRFLDYISKISQI